MKITDHVDAAHVYNFHINVKNIVDVKHWSNAKINTVSRQIIFLRRKKKSARNTTFNLKITLD